MEPILAKLEELDRKLDYVVERQQYIEELIDEMTPVAREAMTATAEQLSEWERLGYFETGRELADLLTRHLGQIVDTVRTVVQPDVLELASEATDVLHHAEEVKPVGPFGALRATSRDEDVRHGMAIALEVLRHLGRARGGHTVPKTHTPTAPTAPPPAASEPVRPKLADLPPPPQPTVSVEPAEPVMWEGRRFTPEGFLLDTDQWDEELAQKMAAAVGVTLEEDTWKVLHWARQDYLEHGASPNVRRVAIGSEVGTRRMYELFPKSPGKLTAMLAGIPKPVGCV